MSLEINDKQISKVGMERKNLISVSKNHYHGRMEEEEERKDRRLESQNIGKRPFTGNPYEGQVA